MFSPRDGLRYRSFRNNIDPVNAGEIVSGPTLVQQFRCVEVFNCGCAMTFCARQRDAGKGMDAQAGNPKFHITY